MRVFGIVFGVMLGVFGSLAQAQQQKVWVQIDAQTSLTSAMDRARAYGALLDQVQGYRLPSGAYAIVLGPMESDTAVAMLHSLMAQNMIAADSSLADGRAFGPQFWPVGAQATSQAEGLIEQPAIVEIPAEGLIEQPAIVEIPAEERIEQPAIVEIPAEGLIEQPAIVEIPTEGLIKQPAAADSPAEAQLPLQTPPNQSLPDARAAEVGLDEEARREVQTALKWFGFYGGMVDGSIGSGSRAAMANWQTQQGYDPTGVLTTGQRTALIDSYRAEQTAFGFETVNDPASGIEISLPMAMLGYEDTSAPFVRYGPKNGSGVTALLISQPGGTKANLSGLYDVLQNLDIMPIVGDRALKDSSFFIQGRNDQIETLAYAQIVGGAVKGYVLSWQAANTSQMQRGLVILRASFRATGDAALDPGLVPLDEAAKRGLLAGLSVQQPKLSRTGFFIDQKGSVLTTFEAVDGCGTVTLDQSYGAKVTFADKASGLAVLTPDVPLSPRSVASFATQAPKLGSTVAVVGFSYGARLPAPVLTQGTLEETQGLNGEPELSRLTMQVLPGDAGGPVIDGAGVVVGMLLPARTTDGKDLPAGVAFAASASALAGVLTDPQGPALTLAAATGGEAPTPNALNAAARDMTVLVSCWE